MVLSRYAKFAWGVLVYTLIVILWGAFVRATGSGAGCGAHWPKCNGEIIPPAPRIATLIEFSHRLTTGFSGLLVIALVFGAFRWLPRRHPARWGAALTLAFVLLEGMVGAVQVKLGLVADNASSARAIIGGIHLVNTFLLLGAMVLTAWWASTDESLHLRSHGEPALLLGVALLGTLLLGASGSITALGDTLFPVSSFAEGLAQDFSGAAPYLIQLRKWHPIIAVAVGAYSVYIGWRVSAPGSRARRFAQLVAALFGIQLVAGTLNVLLAAPIAMQIIHLLLADLLWIALVLLTSTVLAQRREPVVVAVPARTTAARL